MVDSTSSLGAKCEPGQSGVNPEASCVFLRRPKGKQKERLPYSNVDVRRRCQVLVVPQLMASEFALAAKTLARYLVGDAMNGEHDVLLFLMSSSQVSKTVTFYLINRRRRQACFDTRLAARYPEACSNPGKFSRVHG